MRPKNKETPVFISLVSHPFEYCQNQKHRAAWSQFVDPSLSKYFISCATAVFDHAVPRSPYRRAQQLEMLSSSCRVAISGKKVDRNRDRKDELNLALGPLSSSSHQRFNFGHTAPPRIHPIFRQLRRRAHNLLTMSFRNRTECAGCEGKRNTKDKVYVIYFA
jgi:hypothetical protein